MENKLILLSYHNHKKLLQRICDMKHMFNNYQTCTAIYEKSLMTDFIYYYLRKTSNDIIFIKNRSIHYNFSLETVNLKINEEDFQFNILNNYEKIQREIFGALILNCLLPGLIDNDTYYDIIHNDRIKEIGYYSMCDENEYINPCVFTLNEHIESSELLLPYRKFINAGLYTLLTNNFNTDELFNWLSLLIIKTQKFNYYIVYDGAGLSDRKLDNLLDSINIDKCLDYCIECEYYRDIPYLMHYRTITENEIYQYNDVIKPWAQKNIYPKINGIYDDNDLIEYAFYGIDSKIYYRHIE